jgi:hypothetical protein
MALVKVTDPELLSSLSGDTEDSKKTPKNLVPVTDPETIASLVPTPEAPKEALNARKEEPVSSTFGALESLLTVGSSIVAEPIAGISGLVEALGAGAASPSVTEQIQKTREKLTYAPRTVEGQQALQSFGEVLAPVAEALIGVSETLGDATLNVTDSPELATLAYSTPTALLEIMGIKGLSKAKQMTPSNVAKVTKQIEDLRHPVRKFDSSLAEVKLDAKGNLVTDKIGKKLVEADFPETTTAVATNATKESKRVMNNMLDTLMKTKTNDVLALQEKVSSVVGKPVEARLNALKAFKANAGKRLDSIADTSLKQVNISLDVPAASMAERLAKDFGASLTVTPNGTMSLKIPKDSALANKAFKGTRDTLNNLLSLVNKKVKNGNINGYDAHVTKRLLDEFINSSKVSEAGITGNTMRLVSDFRRNINEQLRQVSPEYGKVNDRLSMILQTEQPFKRFSDGKVSAPTSEIVGSAMRNLGGDTVAAKTLKADILRLDDTIKALGGNFRDEPLALLAFKEGIEKFYKITDEVLENQIAGASRQQRAAILDAIGSGSVGNVFGVAHDIKKLVNAGINKKEAAQIVKNRAKVTQELKKALQE